METSAPLVNTIANSVLFYSVALGLPEHRRSPQMTADHYRSAQIT